jgi:hypothetical protein
MCPQRVFLSVSQVQLCVPVVSLHIRLSIDSCHVLAAITLYP